MKNTFLLLFILLFSTIAFSQQTASHFPERPPVNPGYPFVRGMYVDCADEIIRDISNSSALGMEQQLTDYIQRNYIGYIILCGLEHSNIFGNTILENSLRDFIVRMRQAVPGIQIGIAGSDDAFFQQTAFLKASDYFVRDCFPSNGFKSAKELERIINDAGNTTSSFKRSELNKFLTRAAAFGIDKSSTNKSSAPCARAFDALYVQYRYWNQSSFQTMKNEFENFKQILRVMKTLKCNFTCIKNADAEFNPTEQYNLQSWTAIDQITEADPLIDRMMIPAFTSDHDRIFDLSCKTYHFLSDKFSKPGTSVFLEISGESPSFTYCNSALTPHNYLGDYLNGTTSVSGNMYSVERTFLDKWNDPTYTCYDCQCRTYDDNHFSTTKPDANYLKGTMWLPYSMLNQNNLYKTAKSDSVENIEDEIEKIQFIDLNGRIILSCRSIVMDNLTSIQKVLAGVYFKKIFFKGGRVKVEKVIGE